MRTWDVEFTDEFGIWWESLQEAEQETVAAAVRCSNGLGHSCHTRTAAASRRRDTATCES